MLPSLEPETANCSRKSILTVLVLRVCALKLSINLLARISNTSEQNQRHSPRDHRIDTNSTLLAAGNEQLVAGGVNN